jgi:hypothetical protein
LEFGIWNLEFGIWNLEFGIWNLEFGIWNLVLRVHPTSSHLKSTKGTIFLVNF